jgi:1-acyl-sn-glycerol-3-phosphate acyltransferase
MKNKIIRYWIVLRSFLATLKYSLMVFFFASIGRGTRERNNNIIRGWARRLLEIIELQYQVFNPYQIDFSKPGHYIVMCNHSSVYDIPLSLVAIDGTLRMLAKKELSRIPFLGGAMKKSEFIFVDRYNRSKALEDLAAAKAKMESGVIMWIAPEGTRSFDGNLLPFKKGGFMVALQTGATIIPMGIRGVRDILENKTFKVNRRQKVEVHIGQAIDTTQYTIKDRDQLMLTVEKAIKEAAGLS